MDTLEAGCGARAAWLVEWARVDSQFCT